MLKLYNSINHKKEIFSSINFKEIKIYVCGVTVYDFCHIGHARTYIFFDLVARYFNYLGYKVKLVRNITDLDDKILHRAQQEQCSYTAISNRFREEMQLDFAALNLLPPSYEPKATEYIPAMLNLINQLLQDDYAYVGGNGDLFYNISKFKSYGHLAQRSFENFQHTARVKLDILEAKHNPEDFVLWKLVDATQTGWDSPWGYGRPGWHTECAAMALNLFNHTLDIHGGGCDLMFPHHENEIAQVEAITSRPLANYWMHVGYLNINHNKMSKSLGNFITIRDLLKKVHPEVLRLFMLSSHYRSQIEFDYSNLFQAKQALEGIYLALRGVKLSITINLEDHTADLKSYEAYLNNFIAKFEEAMNDDFNTPLALSILFALTKELNVLKEQGLNNHNQLILELIKAKISLVANVLIKLGNVLGLLYNDSEVFLLSPIKLDHLTKSTVALNIQEIEALILARNNARKSKDWSTADAIRQKLLEQEIILEDHGEATTWRKK